MQTDILIIGGGLAGLALADRLETEGRDWHLLEAMDRLGGRIFSPVLHGAKFDLGPAWFWPGQPRIDALIRRHELRAFEQYSEGAVCFQDQTGAVHRNRGFASMQGSFRIEGGMEALIVALKNGLPCHRYDLKSPVEHLSLEDDGVRVLANEKQYTAKQIVFAVPPRIIAETITLHPSLPKDAETNLAQIPTWMAGQAKIVAVFDQPYWRNAGLSGDAMSHRGPMVEIHDASPLTGRPYALFGFVGVPASIRAEHASDLLRLARAQLVDIFGEDLSDPLEIRLQDWASVPTVATERDKEPPGGHPTYGTPHSLNNVWNGRLLFGATEFAETHGGYLEGALEAAEMIHQKLQLSAAHARVS
ncbi:MAG: FAD-dependent oxidoreductase [Henriciella sp.]